MRLFHSTARCDSHFVPVTNEMSVFGTAAATPRMHSSHSTRPTASQSATLASSPSPSKCSGALPTSQLPSLTKSPVCFPVPFPGLGFLCRANYPAEWYCLYKLQLSLLPLHRWFANACWLVCAALVTYSTGVSASMLVVTWWIGQMIQVGLQLKPGAHMTHELGTKTTPLPCGPAGCHLCSHFPCMSTAMGLSLAVHPIACPLTQPLKKSSRYLRPCSVPLELDGTPCTGTQVRGSLISLTLSAGRPDT
jgi:hypothetical protein